MTTTIPFVSKDWANLPPTGGEIPAIKTFSALSQPTSTPYSFRPKNPLRQTPNVNAGRRSDKMCLGEIGLAM
jgi:hypothetical protein